MVRGGERGLDIVVLTKSRKRSRLRRRETIGGGGGGGRGTGGATGSSSGFQNTEVTLFKTRDGREGDGEGLVTSLAKGRGGERRGRGAGSKGGSAGGGGLLNRRKETSIITFKDHREPSARASFFS